MMDLDQKLRKKQYDQIWEEYCGFLDLSLSQYMDIQNRLMLEQISIYSDCELGRRIMKGKKPSTVSEYRKEIPLTKYEDYADLLLSKVETALPVKPLLWIETTWEGAKNPIKVAPYSEGMIKNYSNSIIAIIILATSTTKGQFSLRGGENFLYGMAPLPYLTGLIPHLVSEQFPVKFLPPIDQAEKLGFRERSKLGFNMGLQKGVDLFFGLSSVVAKMGDTFVSGSSSNGFNLLKNTPAMNKRLIKAWIKSKQEGVPIRPKDVWSLKGLACTGPDSVGLKNKIEEDWGIRPLELFGGTECGCVATETWAKSGLVFYPDVDFYEFIPKYELDKNMENPDYMPNTYLMNELLPDHDYELVVSNFKGGAFMRYRTGDIFRCISLKNQANGIDLPHFAYIDRYPTIIDIAGFTRITEDTIQEAILTSKLDIDQWFAVKDRDSKRSFVHLYVEIGQAGMRQGLTQDLISEHLSIYFRHIDSDFRDLKALLGIDPLKITMLPRGSISKFSEEFGRSIRKMNPSHFDIIEILKIAGGGSRKEVC